MRRRLSTTLTLLTIVAVCVTPLMCGAHSARSTEAELRAYAECFARELGVKPRWNVSVEFVRDSGEGRNNYGSALVSGSQLEARIVFNVFAIERDAYSTRIAALHEVLHVATGELASQAFAYNKDSGVIEAERLVRQMVRWPNWRGVCEKA